MFKPGSSRLACLALVMAISATFGDGMPGFAAGRVTDPALGAHARDDALHAHDRLHFILAQTPILARQPKTAMAGSLAAGAAAVTGAASTLQREVFGFAPYWELSSNGSWNYSLLSTVAYFGLGINGDGSLNTSDSGWAGWNSQDLVNIINSAHQAGDRVVVVIKPSNPAGVPTASTVNQIVTSASATQSTINSTMNAIASKNLDGVNVDFEGTSNGYPNVQSGFTNFMTQLSSQVHSRWPAAMVTADTYGGSASWDGGIFNIGQLAPVVDGLFVMSYDASFSNTPGQAGPNAPMNGWTYNDTTTVTQYLTKAPASKVILGVPYYGYKFSTTTADPYSAIVSGSGAQADTYAGIGADFSCALQLSRNWDNTAQEPWASWWSPAQNDPCQGNHNSWRELYYDDATSLGIKYDLVNTNNLLGTGMWALGYDGSSPDLWQALAAKFEDPWPGQYHPLIPARILDTRSGIGGYSTALKSGQSIDVTVAGRGGIPSTGVAAVVLNATATNPTNASYLTLYPTGIARPDASNLNFTPGQTVPNLVQVAVGKGGKVTVYNFGGTVDVVLDVGGWVSTAFMSSGPAGRYQPLAPARLLDTRNTRPLGANQTLDLQVTGRGLVPGAGVSAVVLNLTITNPSAASHLIAYPTGAAQPLASNLNYVSGATVANRAVVQVGTGGKVTLYNLAGQADVIVDVGGWFTDSSPASISGGLFTGLSPSRILDTRYGTGGIRGRIGAGSVSVAVAGQGGVPPLNATTPPTAVVMNVTVTGPTAWSHLTVYPDGTTLPTTSDLNFTAGLTVPNLVIARLGADGKVAVLNYAGSTDLVIDVLGWYN